MVKKKKLNDRDAEIRKLAEKKLRGRKTSVDKNDPAEVKKLLHELEVHQIELEMQNEELHVAQSALEDSAKKYFVLYNFAPIGYLTLSDIGTIDEANLIAADLFGVTRKQVIKRPITHFVVSEDQYVFYLHKNQLYETREKQQFEIRMKGKDGSIFWANVGLTLIENKDGRFADLVMITDCTERKRAESIIQKQMDQLQELNVTKNKFFRIIAHDLKHPFQGLMSLTAMIASGDEEFTKDDLLEIDKDLHKSASAIYKLLENLLEWAQMQSDSHSFTPEELKLSYIVLQNLDVLNQSILQKGITIINEVSETQYVYADKRMINSVLRNLLSNSVKFTSRGGSVTIRAKKTDNEMVEISVTDTGVGIPDNDVKRLFKIDEKVSSKGTEGETSTGLGLLLCKEFVEKHGGKIWVESKINNGSRFYFTTPEKNCYEKK